MDGKKLSIIFNSILILVVGSLLSLCAKFQYLTKSDGLPDAMGNTLRKFEHPAFLVLLMFLGELYCLPLYYIFRLFQSNSNNEIGLREDTKKPSLIKNFLKNDLLLALPCICDLITTGMISISLKFLDASIIQMLRGANLIFISLLSWLVLKKKLTKNNIFGLIIVTIGILVIGSGCILKIYLSKKSEKITEVPTQKIIIAIFLVLASQLVSATQGIFEEIIVKAKKIPPSKVVGLEGLYGVVLASIVLFALNKIPGQYITNNRIEDTLDTFKMLNNNYYLLMLCVFYTIIVAFSNLLSMSLLKKLTAIHRCLLMILKSVAIWIMEIFIFYVCKSTVYGTSVDAYSIIKVFGFSLLILGSVIYNKPAK